MMRTAWKRTFPLWKLCKQMRGPQPVGCGPFRREEGSGDGFCDDIGRNRSHCRERAGSPSSRTEKGASALGEFGING